MSHLYSEVIKFLEDWDGHRDPTARFGRLAFSHDYVTWIVDDKEQFTMSRKEFDAMLLVIDSLRGML